MMLSAVFEEKPKRWGLRGDPFFWDYLRNKADDMEVISPYELEEWIKKEYLQLTGKEITRNSIEYVELFAHGGMSSGNISGEWWIETGIPLLKSGLIESK